METHDGTTTGNRDHPFYGRVVGVVRERSQLQPLFEALAVQGIDDSEAQLLEGDDGIQEIQRWLDLVSGYLMGDMEIKMVKCYLDAVTSGLIVLTVPDRSGDAEMIAETAKAAGLTNVVHFGNTVVTNY